MATWRQYGLLQPETISLNVSLKLAPEQKSGTEATPVSLDPGAWFPTRHDLRTRRSAHHRPQGRAPRSPRVCGDLC